jgi:multisubunit Na+/H+ antiporter MnhG subunit
METNRARLRSIAAVVLGASAFFLFVPPIAQDDTYHLFADCRTVWSIPNFWNVASNLPFALVGVLGLWKLRRVHNRVLFTGVLLTFFGSAYYHLAPSDARLVWDRLSMTLVFMPLLACVLSQENDARSSRWLLAFLVICGVGSVLWWSVTNDLRLYILVQFGPLVILIPSLWFVRDARFLIAVLALYGLAKLAEFYDRATFSDLPVSGHTAKHVLAAIATYFILRWRLAASVPASASALCESAEAASY